MAKTNGKHPGGRPTDYDPKICEGFEKRFEKGQSILEVAVSLGVTRKTLYNWAEEHEEFLHALTRGREVCQSWWEQQGRENLFDTEEYDAENHISTKRKLNDRLWTKNMASRFRDDWADRQEITGLNGAPLNFAVSFVKPKKG
jgi:transposase-like protein